MNKIVIFGATGMTGLCVVKAAIDKGCDVRVFVRDESKVPEEYKEKVDIVVGNVLNLSEVEKAVADRNGVIVTLGTRNDLKPTTDLSNGLKNIISAMKTNNVEVISCCMSAFLFYEPSKVPPVFTDINAEHQRMSDILKASDLKFIAVNPPHIADNPSSDYIVEFDKSPARVVSKWDLGKFFVESLSKPEYYGRVVGIASK